MTRPKGRTASCSKVDARNRFKRPESFLVVADLVLGERVETPDQDDGRRTIDNTRAVLRS